MHYEFCINLTAKVWIFREWNEGYNCKRKNILKKHLRDINLYPIFAEEFKNLRFMPELFRMFGIRFYFHSREHEPIHVHVENADGEAKFEILPHGVILKENYGLKPRDLKLAEAILEDNKELAISEWKQYFENIENKWQKKYL